MSLNGGASPPLFPDNEKFDGTNWIAWSENILIATCMRGASGYLNGTIKWPSTTNIPVTTTTTSTEKPSPTPITTTTSETNTKWKSLNPSEDEWESRDNWVKGLLIYNTKNPVGLGIKIKGMAAEAWISYTEQYEVATKLARLATERDLRNSTYSDHEDFTTFITIMRNKWAKANSLGSNIDDDDFKNILLTSLPLSWSPIVATCLKEGSSCHKLHSAISPSILHWFSRSQWLRKALEKTFRSIPVTSRGNQ